MKRGFSLVELLVVIAILGILTSIMLSVFAAPRRQARDDRRVADLRQVQQGLELYYTRFQEYPKNISGWNDLRVALVGSNIGITNVSNDPLCKGSVDDTSCTDNYMYGGNTDGSEYILQALLEDKDSPLIKDSYNPSLGGGTNLGSTRCATTRGNRFFYCVKF